MVWMGDEQVDKHLSTLSSLVFIPGWELQTKQPQLFCKQRIKIIYTLQSRRQGRWRWRWRWTSSEPHTGEVNIIQWFFRNQRTTSHLSLQPSPSCAGTSLIKPWWEWKRHLSWKLSEPTWTSWSCSDPVSEAGHQLKVWTVIYTQVRFQPFVWNTIYTNRSEWQIDNFILG